MNKWIGKAVDRWRAQTPLLFKRIIKIALSISAIALGINGALEMGHADIPIWWSVVYPYLIGVPAGMSVIAKFTQEYDENGNPKRKEKK